MGTVNGWRAVEGGGVWNWRDESSVNEEDGERLSKLSPTSSCTF